MGTNNEFCFPQVDLEATAKRTDRAPRGGQDPRQSEWEGTGSALGDREPECGLCCGRGILTTVQVKLCWPVYTPGS